MKAITKIFVIASLLFCFFGATAQTIFTEGFDSGLPGTYTYSEAIASLGSGSWTINAAKAATDPYARTGNDAASIDGGAPNRYLTTPLLENATEFSFWYRSYANCCDGAVFDVKTSDDGSSYATLSGGSVSTFSETYLEFSHTFTEPFTGYIRIEGSGSGDQDIIVDDFEATLNEASSITVTSPTSASKWSLNGSLAINWTSEGIPGDVNIKLSTDGGSTFPTTIVSSTANDGAYSWLYPNPTDWSSEAVVRVEDASNAAVYDDSEVFNFAPIAFYAPAAASTLEPGAGSNNIIIQFGDYSFGSVDIEYSTNGGSTWTTIEDDYTACLGGTCQFNWTVPDVYTEVALIRVTSASGAWVVTSDEFTINGTPPAPEITLTYPTSNSAVLRTGQIRNITWTSQGVNNVKLRYSNDGGNFDWITIVESVDASLGSYEWTVPVESNQLNTIVVEISDVDEVAETVESSGFKIYPALDAYFSETFDEAPETLYSQGYQWNGRSWYFSGSSTSTDEDVAGNGKAVRIPNNSWLQTPYITDPNKVRLFVKSSGTSNVTIQKSIGEGQFANVNEVPLPVTSAAYTQIEVTPELTGSVQFRILVSGNDLYVDDLEVLEAPATPSITITSPNGGESWIVGTSQNITWTSQNVPGTDNLQIRLATDGGVSYSELLAQGTASSFNGSYTWDIPANRATSTMARISVQNATQTGVYDYSNSNFTIAPVPVVEFTTVPEYYLGQEIDVPFEFTTGSLPENTEVTIELSTNGGQSYTALATNTLSTYAEAVDYQYTTTFTSNANLTYEAKLRIKAGTLILGTSDIFAIINPGVLNLEINYPFEGYDFLVKGVPASVSWTNDGIATADADVYLVVPGVGATLLSGSDETIGNEVTYTFTPAVVGSNAKVRVVANEQNYETGLFSIIDRVQVLDTELSPITQLDLGIIPLNDSEISQYNLATYGVTVDLAVSGSPLFTIATSIDGTYSTTLEDVGSAVSIASTPIFVKGTVDGAANEDEPFQASLAHTFTGGGPINLTLKGRTGADGPSMVITSPDEAAQLITNSVVTIGWSATEVALLKIEYSLDGGTEWFLIEDGLSPSFTQFQWLVPNVASLTQAKVRITDQAASGAAPTKVIDFDILPAPSITDLSKTGNVLTITGTGFSTNAVFNQVVFPGFPDINAYPLSATATELQVEIPSGAVSGFIRVNVTDKGTAISQDQLELAGVALDPDRGQAGQTIYINGSGINFVTATNVAVTFTNGVLGSVNATEVTKFADQLAVVVPEGVEENGAIEVDVDGTVYTTPQQFKVQSIDFEPKTAGVFETVTVSGVNTNFLSNGTQVFINGLAASSISVVSNTQINVTVPQGASSGRLTISTNDGFYETSEDLTVEQHKITSLSATRITKGQTLVITGDNFTGTTSVKVNGVTVNPSCYLCSVYFAVNSDQQITIYATPSSISGTGKVSVTKGGVEVESTEDVTVIPAVNFISPSQAAPGAQVTISGSYFSSVDNTVYFSDNKPAAIVSQNASSITVVVPQGATDGTIRVVNNDVAQEGVSSSSFDAVAAPVFTSFSPLKAASGVQVTVTGQNFQNPTPTQVRLNGSNIGFTVVDNNSLRFTVPSNLHGEGIIEITKGGVTVASVQNFVILPSISSFTLPTGAVVGATVTISGTGFNPTPANNEVKFSNNVTATITSGSSTFLNVTVPAGAQTGKLRVTNKSILETAESTNDFLVVPNASIASFTPGSGQITKTEVTITGQNFGSPNPTNVRFNGTNATFEVISNTEIKATVPYVTTNGVISLVRAGETVSSTQNFNLSPDITGLSATTLASGASLSISGTFLNQSSQVFVGSTQATITSNNSFSSNTVTVPVMTPGTYKVRVVKNGLEDTSDADLTVVAPHTISSFTQVAGPGQDVTITGTNFTSPAVTSVSVNGYSTTIKSASATQLVVTLPASMFNGGQGKISIVRAGLTVQSTTDLYVRHGISTTFNTQNYIVGQQITVSGSNFRFPNVSQVTVNGVNASFFISNDNALSVTIPNAVGTGKVRVIKASPVGTVESSTDITVVPRAVLSSFSPTIQAIGQTITITGQNFTNPDVSSISINNATVSSFTVNSATEITATVPSITSFNTQGSVVITRGGLSETRSGFTVKHTISSVTPATVAAGATVTVSGTFFTSPSAAVTLEGTGVSVGSISGNSLTFTVSTNTTPGANEVVLTRLGEAVSGGDITVLAPHTIVSLNTDRVVKSGEIVITGTNFDNSPQVYVNGALATSTVDDTEHITLTVPANITGGTASIMIRRGGLDVSTFAGGGTAQFYIIPTVSTDITATNYVLGQTVDLVGSNFTGPNVSSVEIDGQPVQTTVLSDNTIRIVLSSLGTPLTTGTFGVTIIKTTPEPDLELTLGDQITLVGQATIAQIAEASAPAGANVTIEGTGFEQPNVTSVRINGALVSNFSIESDTEITAQVPSAALAYGDANNIELVRGGLTVSQSDAFIVEHRITGFLKANFQTINPVTERVVEGQTIYVEGSHFESSGSITAMSVNGEAVTPTFVNGNRLQIVIPAGSQGVGKVTIIRRGIEVESAQALMISPAATVTSVEPLARIAGATITIKGTNFTLPDVETVTVNGAAVNTFDILNSENIKVTVPSNATATGNITVTRGGVVSNGQVFEVIPKIFNFTNTGLEGSTVTINGSHFGSSPGNNQVAFTGASGFVSATISAANANSITVTVPDGAITGPIKVTNSTSEQSVTSSANFNLLPEPGSFSIDPASGPVASQFTIDGVNLNGVSEVTINSVQATTFTVDPDGTSITVAVPSSATSGSVVVKKSGQSFTAGTFNVTPKVISFPALAVVGSVVTINGKTFTGATSVTINNVAATVTQVSSDFVKVTPVVGNVGVSNIVVTTPSGSGTSSSTIEIKGQPELASFSPASGSTGDVVTISGANLSTVTFVKFNNVNASFTISSDSELSAIVPSGASTGKISLGLGGITIQSANNFGIVPKITTFTASAVIGATIQLNGVNFTGANQVSFNGTNATPFSVTASSLQVTVPVAATTGPLTVTTTSGTSAPTANNFQVVPAINTSGGFTPTKGVAGTTVTIVGTGFVAPDASQNVVNFTGGATATASAATATSLTVQVPSGALTGPLSVTVNGSVTGPQSAASFGIVPQIATTGLSVTSAYPGDNLVITGTGFHPTAANNSINFAGSVSAVPFAATTTSLSVAIPAGFATGTITVTSAGEISAASAQTLTRKSVTVTAPNGGEVYNLGDAYNITWSTTGMAGTEDVVISYSVDGGTTYTELTSGTVAGLNGVYSWTPAGDPTTTARIRVSADAGKAQDASNANFTVRIKPLLTITSPNGGEVLRFGQSNVVEFATEGLASTTSLLFQYSLDGGTNYVNLGTGTIGALSGKFTLSLPDQFSENVLIRVSTASGEAFSDVSNEVFTLWPRPQLTIGKPLADELLYIGEPYEVQWTTNYVLATDELALSFSADNGQTFTAAGSGTVASLAGKLAVTVSGEPSAEAYFKLENTASGVAAQSAKFRTAYRPTITLTNPVAGGQYTSGSTVDITFTTAGIDAATPLVVSYSLDNRVTFTEIASVTVGEAQGVVSWTLGNETTNAGFVTVTTADGSVSGTNAEPFTIVAPPSIEVMSPASGEVVAGGSTKTITWATTSIAAGTTLVVEYSPDGGATYTSLGEGTLEALSGAIDWAVPNEATAQGFIRVRTADATVSDTNNEAFIVQAQATSLSISGVLTTPSGAAVNVADVLLYKANPQGGWDIVDTDNLVLSQNRNTYTFTDLDPADYLIFAKPDRVRFPSLRNTWFGNTLLVRDAVTVSLAESGDAYNIEVVEVAAAPAGRGVVRGRLVNTSGSGRVSGLHIGRILNDGAPLVGVTVNLLDNATGAFVKDAETDENGLFEMRGLVIGQYRLSVELAGVPMDFGSSVIELANENDDVALTALVTEDGTVLVNIDEVVAGVNDPLVLQKLVAYPMPVQEELTLELTNKKAGDLKLVIFNLAGLQVFESPVLKASKGDHQWSFDLSHLNNGMYMGKFVLAETNEILPYQLKIMVSK